MFCFRKGCCNACTGIANSFSPWLCRECSVGGVSIGWFCSNNDVESLTCSKLLHFARSVLRSPMVQGDLQRHSNNRAAPHRNAVEFEHSLGFRVKVFKPVSSQHEGHKPRAPKLQSPVPCLDSLVQPTAFWALLPSRPSICIYIYMPKVCHNQDTDLNSPTAAKRRWL